MADEIERANVIRIECRGPRRWRAAIGPRDGRGLTAAGNTPLQAGARLLALCEALGWAWDESWRDRDGPTYGPMVDH